MSYVIPCEQCLKPEALQEGVRVLKQLFAHAQVASDFLTEYTAELIEQGVDSAHDEEDLNVNARAIGAESAAIREGEQAISEIVTIDCSESECEADCPKLRALGLVRLKFETIHREAGI